MGTLGLATGLRLWLISTNPFMPLGDSYGRLVDPTLLLKAGWLPGYQATLAAVSTLTRDPAAFRVLTALEGVAAVAAVAAVAVVAGASPAVADPAAARAVPLRAALTMGLGTALLPSFVLPSTGLYQEPLFTALACSAIALLGQARPAGGHGARAAAVALVGASCLVRYEGWPFALVVGAWLGRRGRWWEAAACLLLPAAWGLFAPTGTGEALQHLDVGVSTQRVVDRIAILGRLLIDWRLWPLLVPAAMGSWQGRAWTQSLLLVLALDVAWLAVLDPYSPGDNYRQLWVPLLCVLGLAASWGSEGARHLGVTLACLGACMSGWQGRTVAQLEPFVEAAASAGERLRGVVGPEARALVLSEGLRRWPDARPDACEVFVVYARTALSNVRCDSQLAPGGADGDEDVDGLRAWLDGNRVAYIVRVGDFDDWRPAQGSMTELLATASTGVAPVWTRTVDTARRLAIWTRAGSAPEQGSPSIVDNTGACAATPGSSLPTDATRVGTAVQAEPGRIAFYTNGSLAFRASRSGTLRIAVCGTAAAGQLPSVRVQFAGQVTSFRAAPQPAWVTLGPVREGDPVEVRYEDDLVAADGSDRNLFVMGVQVGP